MLGQYFYHEIIRKTVIGFGTLFNNIEVRTRNPDGSFAQVMKVPLAYGPMSKFLALIEQQSSYKNRVQITLPRMSFEMIGLQYDPTRKTSVTQTFNATNTGKNANLKKVYMPVPYNVDFVLSIATKQNDDMLQIVEQILPYFQPSLNLTINLIESIGEKKDIPVVLNNISMATDYEGSFDNRNTVIYNLTFTAKTYIFGPISDSTSGLIKKVDVDYYTNVNNTAKREIRYSVTPRATKDYNNDQSTQITEVVSTEEFAITVNDSSLLSTGSYIQIGSELMKIKEIDENIILVDRAQDGSIAETHQIGDVVNLVDRLDDELIEFGDDFGFNETTSFFQDFKSYSPVTGSDY